MRFARSALLGALAETGDRRAGGGVDTNLLVSATLSRTGSTPRKLLDAIRDGRLKLVLSRPLVDEFLEVMSRPKVARYGLMMTDMIEFVEGLLEVASYVEITGEPRGCLDRDDDAVIETAEVGAAVFVITGDKDLKTDDVRSILRRNGIVVVTASAFLHDKLLLIPSAASVSEQARMVVAGQVASAIALSSWQLTTIVSLLESYRYNVMISFADLRRRLAAHQTELAELKSCDGLVTNVVARCVTLEAEIVKTDGFQKMLRDSLSDMTEVVAGVRSRLEGPKDRA